MSKAILVIDMPDSCKDCKIMYTDDYSNWCPCNYKEENGVWKYVNNDSKPNWCHLKPVPEKKKERYAMCRQNSLGTWDAYGETVDSVAIGYNQCIDKILGDEK